MTAENYSIQARVASLQAEAFAKLAEAKELESKLACCGGCGDDCGGAVPEAVQPQADQPAEGQVVLMIPQGVRTASLRILNKVAAALVATGEDENIEAALEIDRIAEEISRTAATITSDKDEPFMKAHFHAGVVSDPENLPYMKEFKTDVSAEVKKALPYQPIRDAQ